MTRVAVDIVLEQPVVVFAQGADGADVNVYTGADPTAVAVQGGSPTRSGDTLQRQVDLASAQFVFFTVVK